MDPSPLGEVRHLASLGFAERGRALALRALGWPQQTADAVLAALDAGDADERCLGLALAAVRRDVVRVEAALHDPALRRAALGAARQVPVSDEALAALVRDGRREDAQGALEVIRHTRRAALAGRLLPEVKTKYGVTAARRLWRVCDLHVLERDAVEQPLAWQEIVRRAPSAALRLALAHGRKLGQSEVTHFCAACPEQALALLVRPDALPVQAMGVLVMECPADLLAVLRRNDWTVTIPAAALTRPARLRLLALPAAEITELHARCRVPRHDGWHPLFSLLPLGERERLVAEDLGLAALAGWDMRGTLHERTLHGRLRAMPRASVHFLTNAALAAPAVAEVARKRLTVLQDYLTLDQVRAQHELLGPAVDRQDRGERFVALVSALRFERDPATCAAVLAEVEPAWHDSTRRLVLPQLSWLPKARVTAVPVQVYRDAALTATQARDVDLATLRAAEDALRTGIDAALERDEITRAAHLLEVLVQVRLDPRVRFGAAVDPAPGVMSAKEHAPRALGITTAVAQRLRAAYRPVRIDGTTPMSGPVPVRRYEPAAELRIVGVLLGDEPDQPARAPTCSGPLADVLPWIKTIALWATQLVDGLLDRSDVTDPHTMDLVAAVPPEAPARWTPSQRRRFQAHLLRVAADAGLEPARRGKAIQRIVDPEALLALLPATTGPVAAAILTRTARIAAPTPELSRLLLDRARHAGVVGRAAMCALDVLSDRAPPPLDITPYRELLLDRSSAVVNRRASAVRIGASATLQARDLLLTAWCAAGIHADVRPPVLSGLLRFVDEPEVRRALREGLTTVASAPEILRQAPPILCFPGEASVRPAVSRGFVALAESLVDSEEESLSAAALEVCIREHDLCSEGLEPARRHLIRRATPTSVVTAITRALGALPPAACRPTWQSALAELALAAAQGAPWAMQRLAGFVLGERTLRLTLAEAQQTGGLHLTAAASFKRVLEADLDLGRVDADLWSTYLAHIDEQPGRRIAWTAPLKAPVAAGALIDLLIRQGGAAAALTAADLLLLLGASAKGEPAWRARASAIIALHADAAERVLLAEPAR